MEWSQTIGSATLPTNDDDDQLLIKLANHCANYLNHSVGNAWKKLFNDDGYVVRNVHYCNPNLLDEAINQQLPALFCWREEIEREPFTVSYELITSKVMIQLIMPLTPTYGIDNRIQLFEKVGKSIESMIRRNRTIDGYELSDELNTNKIQMKKSKAGEYTSRYVFNPGILQSTTELLIEEIVDPSSEGYEDLEAVNINLTPDEYENFATVSFPFPIIP